MILLVPDCAICLKYHQKENTIELVTAGIDAIEPADWVLVVQIVNCFWEHQTMLSDVKTLQK